MAKYSRCVLLISLVSLLGAVPSAPAATTCDRVASPTGNDSGAGTLESPFGTAEQLADSLTPGQTGCFRAGTYSFTSLRIETEGITLAPYGSEDVTLAGHIEFQPTGANSVIEGMKLDGSATSDTKIGPKIYASGVVLRDNEITNNNTDICVHINSSYDDPPPVGVVIERNRIHHCGVLPATNLDHGIYIAHARNTIIRDNWIYANADVGITQYPDAVGSLITGNVIDGNGMGVGFSCDDDSCSRGNVVEGNVITNSNVRHNVYGSSGGPTPNGSNVLRNNCVFASNSEDWYNKNGGVLSDPKYFSEAANLIAAPAYVNRAAGDYRLQPSSPCLAKYTGTMSLNGSALEGSAGKPERVKLRASRRSVRRGGSLSLRGRVPSALASSPKVVIERRRNGVWRPIGSAPIRRDRRFVERIRPRRAQRTALRARVEDGRHSRHIQITVRRPRR